MPAVSPPAGATWIDDWQGINGDRGRHFDHPDIEICDVAVNIRGVQCADGHTGRGIRLRINPGNPLNDGLADLTSPYARRLAAMLQNFADTCELLDVVTQ